MKFPPRAVPRARAHWSALINRPLIMELRQHYLFSHFRENFGNRFFPVLAKMPRKYFAYLQIERNFGENIFIPPPSIVFIFPNLPISRTLI